MNKIIFILPTQLFHNFALIDSSDNSHIYLIEDHHHFQTYKYHKLKLIYHRISMKIYFGFLSSKFKNVHYFDIKNHNGNVFSTILKDIVQPTQIHMYDPINNVILTSIEKAIKEHKHSVSISLHLETSPYFLSTRNDLYQLYQVYQEKGTKLSHAEFYKFQRKRLDILMPPKDGKWSYDTENRQKFPKDSTDVLDYEMWIKYNIKQYSDYIEEAQTYIDTYFPNNYGNHQNLLYPLTHKDAIKWLKEFIKNRLKHFGDYEDAFDSNILFGYHSVLSPCMNIGLITSRDVINEILKLNIKEYGMNNIEGFIRQIIGWREYSFYIYINYADEYLKMNYFNHHNKLDESYWTGTTGIIPFDNMVKKCLDYAYAHHIERLMISGNLFLLLGIEPKQILRWYNEIVAIDAYDVFMIPNIYGMSQYADGGIMMKRPYFSSSNYILKMSHYKKSQVDGWGDLYVKFIKKQHNKLKHIYMISSQVKRILSKK